MTAVHDGMFPLYDTSFIIGLKSDTPFTTTESNHQSHINKSNLHCKLCFTLAFVFHKINLNEKLRSTFRNKVCQHFGNNKHIQRKCKTEKRWKCYSVTCLPDEPIKAPGLLALRTMPGAPCRTSILPDSPPTHLRGRQL